MNSTMFLNNKKTLATSLIALVATISFLSLASSARYIASSGNIGISGHEIPLLDRSPQSEALKQQNFAARRQQQQQQQLAAMNNILNEPDVADPVQNEQSSLLRRQQRSIVNYDQDFISPMQSLEDEPLMKRQLPVSIYVANSINNCWLLFRKQKSSTNTKI